MKKHSVEGQSFLEYTMIIGVVVMVLTVMAPMMKRSIQAMVKVVADQVGNQQESDQEVDPMEGYLVFSNTTVQSRARKTESSFGGDITYTYGDRTAITTDQSSELGFTEMEKDEY